jgi:NET1-associated nuclear protein 1 (U3 small nucleolar RNA-associated protein 17)
VAAGDITGRILIWSGLPGAAQRAAAVGGQPPDPRTAGMQLFEPPHWHAHSVGALCFSHDGAYLLSGGRENVLVIWQLQTMRRSYLPRLGGPLTHIARCAGDAAIYAIGQQDNAVRVVSIAQMAIVASVFGVRPPPAGQSVEEADAGCAYHPASKCLLLPGLGGSVQMYDIARDRHSQRLVVVARNDVAPTALAGAPA